jgi:hypothetical protein
MNFLGIKQVSVIIFMLKIISERNFSEFLGSLFCTHKYTGSQRMLCKSSKTHDGTAMDCRLVS